MDQVQLVAAFVALAALPFAALAAKRFVFYVLATAILNAWQRGSKPDHN